MSRAKAKVAPLDPGVDDGRAVRLACDAMGTRFEAVLVGDDPAPLRAAGEAALDVVLDWDRRLSFFHPGSTLSCINAHAAERDVTIDGELYELLCAARSVWQDSGGAFDITVAPLMKAWGLRGGVASAAEARSARELVGMHMVEISPSEGKGGLPAAGPSIRFARAGMSIDLGSIAKGAALDAAAATLRECGVTCALVHGGTSSVVAIGAPPGQDAWTIAVETEKDERPVVRLRDRCLSVTAPRGRTARTERGMVGHIIDPRTGVPVERRGTVAVTHPCGALCDAWSTALLVLGERPPTLPVGMSVVFDLTPIRENAA